MFKNVIAKMGTKIEGRSHRASVLIHAVQAEAYLLRAILMGGSMLDLLDMASDPIPPKYEISAPMGPFSNQAEIDNASKAYPYPVTILLTAGAEESQHGCKCSVPTAAQFAKYKSNFPDTPSWRPPTFDLKKGYVVFDDPPLHWHEQVQPPTSQPPPMPPNTEENIMPCEPVLTPEEWARLDAWEAERHKKQRKRWSVSLISILIYVTSNNYILTRIHHVNS